MTKQQRIEAYWKRTQERREAKKAEHEAIVAEREAKIKAYRERKAWRIIAKLQEDFRTGVPRTYNRERSLEIARECGIITDDSDDVDWITTKTKVHVPLEKGQSPEQACKEFFSKKASEAKKPVVYRAKNEYKPNLTENGRGFITKDMPVQPGERVAYIKAQIDEILGLESRFNGDVTIDPEKCRMLGGEAFADWDGTIGFETENYAPGTDIHEVIHCACPGMTAELYSNDVFAKSIDEGVTEQLTREIMIESDMRWHDRKAYDDEARMLTKFHGDVVRYVEYKDEYEFAVELFRTPADKRKECLDSYLAKYIEKYGKEKAAGISFDMYNLNLCSDIAGNIDRGYMAENDIDKYIIKGEV